MAVGREHVEPNPAPRGLLPPLDLLTATVEAPTSDVRVVRLDGEIDLATAPRLREALLSVLDEPVRLVAVDLNGVGFLGAHGLDVLIIGYRTAMARDVRFVLSGGQRPVRRVLSITGLTGLLPVADSVDRVLGG